MDEDDDELDLDLLESIALSTQSTPTAEMPPLFLATSLGELLPISSFHASPSPLREA
jgi:hypothetical protein